jgi:hypothetical protein
MQTGCLCVQAMSSTLVRIEEMGSSGWEDRDTFMAVNRSGEPFCVSALHSLSLSLLTFSSLSLLFSSLTLLTFSSLTLLTLTRRAHSYYTHTACRGASLIGNVRTRQRTECISADAPTKISHSDPRGQCMPCSLARLIARAHALDHPL